MDQGSLVEGQIEDGRKLIDQLSQEGLEVTAAFWMKQDGRWRFYVGSSAVDRLGLREPYGHVHSALDKQDFRWLSGLDVYLLPASDPIVKGVLDVLRRYPIHLVAHYPDYRLGNAFIEDAYLYELPMIAG